MNQISKEMMSLYLEKNILILVGLSTSHMSKYALSVFSSDLINNPKPSPLYVYNLSALFDRMKRQRRRIKTRNSTADPRPENVRETQDIM